MDFYHVELKNGPLAPCAIPNPGVNGAEVAFFGIVRGEENGAPIEGLSYEAHPRLADYWLNHVAEMTKKKYSISAFCLLHAMGFIRTGETSLIVQVQARHRKTAFEACSWSVDELKRRVPIWKRPIVKGETLK